MGPTIFADTLTVPRFFCGAEDKRADKEYVGAKLLMVQKNENGSAVFCVNLISNVLV